MFKLRIELKSNVNGIVSGHDDRLQKHPNQLQSSPFQTPASARPDADAIGGQTLR